MSDGISSHSGSEREVEHFHAIMLDMHTGRVYLASGDSLSESKIWETSDFGDTWTVKLENDNEACRATNIIFTKDGAFYGSDQASRFYRVPRNADGLLDFSSITFIQMSDALGGTNFKSGRTYFSCYSDDLDAIVLLQRIDENNSEFNTGVFVYDIVSGAVKLVRQINVAGKGNAGFRCDAVNVYQSLAEHRFVCGFGSYANFNDIVGNKCNGNGDVRNMWLDVR